MEHKTHIIELKKVNQMYRGGDKAFRAVADINMVLKEGEFTCLLGPSGCGKSTLLRIITGLQKPTEGYVIYREQVLQGVNPHSTIVFQTYALFPWLTVLANVEIALKAKGVPKKMLTARALDLLDRVGLDGFETAYPRELSGGMRQKVGFARAMAVEPELLCLDEPFSALDVLSAEALRSELLELWTSGNIPTRAILMVTHNIEEAVFMADRIILMNKNPGRIISELKVDLPHPRDRKMPAFLEQVDRVYASLAGETLPESIEMGAAPGEPGITRALQHITINDLNGFLENVADADSNRHDIYQLAEDFKIESDLLLNLIEVAELLGFAAITKGDIILTPLGETYAEAGILARKEIFATRIKRLPIFKWLLSMLRASEKQQLAWGVLQTALELEFPAEEAERQIDTIINWGRYAELISYDDSNGVIYLEPEPSRAV